MYNLAKWIGGGLGWVVGGPKGGVLGFIAGTVVDSIEMHLFRKKTKKTQTFGNFSTSILMLIAAVLKAERPVAKAKIDYVKRFLQMNFGNKGANVALIQLKEILKQNIPMDDVCTQICNSLDFSSRLQFANFLNNLASVNGKVTEAEYFILNIISKGLGTSINKNSVGPTIVHEGPVIAAYNILGVHRTTSVINIKKAYRNLANIYHPDKVAYLGENEKKTASEKFQQLTKAYEIIKKERGFM